MLRRVVPLLVCCAALAGCCGEPPKPVTPPRPRVFDPAAVSAGVKHVLTGAFHLTDVDAVSCPANRPVTAGVAFTCTATIAGIPRLIPVIVLGADGRYRVDGPR